MAKADEFDHNDRLALMVANDFGYWAATVEDPQLPLRDAVAMLRQGRQASDLQEELGWTYNLDSLDNCSLAVWAWTGNYSASGGRAYPLRQYEILPTAGYLWNTVDVDQTLVEMREFALAKNWVQANPLATVAQIEFYFYFAYGSDGQRSNWLYTSDAAGHQVIEVDGVLAANHDLNNVDFIWEHFKETGKGIGECGDNTILVEAMAKALGIPVTEVIRQATDSQRVLDSHMFPLVRAADGWTAYSRELEGGLSLPNQYTVYVGRPPIYRDGYLDYWLEEPHRVRWFGNMYYIFDEVGIRDIGQLLSDGLPVDTAASWLCLEQLDW